jgi:uncharacterized protein YraI
MFNHRTITVFMIIIVLAAPVAAQNDPDAYPYVLLNMRTGPTVTYDVIGVLDSSDGLILEARNADTSWVLGHTVDGTFRGWVAAIYLVYRDGFAPARLPASEEIIAVPASAARSALDVGSDDSSPPTATSSYITIPARAYEIRAQGRAMGTNPGGFLKLGDSNAESTRMLEWAFEAGQYDLGPYEYLEPTIARYRDGGSFRHFNSSARGGMTVINVQDPLFRDPQYCHDWISSLECDFQYMNPSVVFIFPTAGDMFALTTAQYHAGLRQIVSFAIERGAVPVLCTWPAQYRSTDINGTIRAVAAEFGVPLIEFAVAVGTLPNNGVYTNDTIHLTGQDYMSFNGDQHQYGYTLLNLLALQTLDLLQ